MNTTPSAGFVVMELRVRFESIGARLSWFAVPAASRSFYFGTSTEIEPERFNGLGSDEESAPRCPSRD